VYLLDTNVISELRKVCSGKADKNVASWADSVDATLLFVSVVSVQEIEIGVLLAERRDVVQGALLRQWLNDHVLPAFAGRIIDINTAIAQRSASLHVPNPHPFRDGLIAATALVHGFTVVTRNVTDFEATGVSLLNPWSSHQFS
jgi:toxin FitB